MTFPAFLGTLPGWITAISSSGVFGVLLYAVIKNGPALLHAFNERRQQTLAAEAERRGEKRADLTDCQRRLDEMSLEMGAVKEKVHQLEMKLLGVLSAYRILDLEVETHCPGSTALGQARAIMSAAFTMSPSTPTDVPPLAAAPKH